MPRLLRCWPGSLCHRWKVAGERATRRVETNFNPKGCLLSSQCSAASGSLKPRRRGNPERGTENAGAAGLGGPGWRRTLPSSPSSCEGREPRRGPNGRPPTPGDVTSLPLAEQFGQDRARGAHPSPPEPVPAETAREEQAPRGRGRSPPPSGGALLSSPALASSVLPPPHAVPCPSPPLAASRFESEGSGRPAQQRP